jgi:hypothetical protein
MKILSEGKKLKSQNTPCWGYYSQEDHTKREKGVLYVSPSFCPELRLRTKTLLSSLFPFRSIYFPAEDVLRANGYVTNELYDNGRLNELARNGALVGCARNMIPNPS